MKVRKQWQRILGALWLATAMAAPPAGKAVAEEAPLALAPGDVVAISVLNRDDLSGSFALRSDGMISLHVLGEMRAAGMTASALEAFLEAELARLTKLPASVTVSVTQWRPVYALGDVQAPGAFAYAPGMTVQQAVALAGGLYRRDISTTTGLDLRVADEAAQIEAIELRIKELEVIGARLEAEAAEAESFAYDDKGDPALAAIVDEQMNVFARRKDITRDRIAAANQALELARGEAGSLAAQQAVLQQQIAEAEASLAKLQELFEKGLTNSERLNQEQRSLNSDRIELMTAATYEARARQQMADAEAAVDEIISGRQRDIAAELADIASQTREQELALASAREFLAEFGPLAAPTAGPAAAGPPVYRVTRAGAGGPVILDLAPTDPLLPGDTVDVLRPTGAPTN